MFVCALHKEKCKNHQFVSLGIMCCQHLEVYSVILLYSNLSSGFGFWILLHVDDDVCWYGMHTDHLLSVNTYT